MPKPELEFFNVGSIPWTPAVPGVPGLTEQILARDGAGGTATRLLRWEPGSDTSTRGRRSTRSGRRSTSSRGPSGTSG